MDQIYVGVDVSKGWIDVSHPSRGAWRVMQGKGFADFAALMAQDRAIVVLEATNSMAGRYDGALRAALRGAGADHVRLTPQSPRRMAQVLQVKIKSDKADAALIQRYGEVFRPRPDLDEAGMGQGTGQGTGQDIPPEDRDLLQDLMTRRRALVSQRAAESTRQQEPNPVSVAASITRCLAHLEAEITTLEALIDAEIDRSPERQDAARRLRTAPGIGPVIAATLLANLPELGRLDRHAIAALAGLAPYANESGKWTGKRFIRGGRPEVRRALYIAGLHASRGKGPLKAFREALKARGRSTKQAIVACARRLLTMLNAMMKTKMDFRTNP